MSYVDYVDLHHVRDEDTERYRATIVLRVEGISRPDAAALTDAVEQCARRITEAHANA